jgi:hypothetical protein
MRTRLLVVLLVLAASMAQAKPVALTVEQMQRFGFEALMRGYADQALEIAETLLQRDANDSQALALKAQALRALGRLPESEVSAKAAWAMAKDKQSRYAAATAVAQALALQDHRTAAQLWLRRAVQNAPSTATRSQALQDFNYVRAQNPLSLQIEASLQPSNNVNGGARDPRFDFYGIPFVLSGDALALSGLTGGLGVQLRYRLAATPQTETALSFAASQQWVALSSQVRAQAPDARNGDYALGQVQIGLEHQRQSAWGNWSFGLVAGHTIYGGDDLANSVLAQVALEHKFTPKLSAVLSGSLTRQQRLDRAISSSSQFALGVELDYRGNNGDRWSSSLSLGNAASDDISIDHSDATLELSWQAGQKVAGIGFGASVAVKTSDFDVSPYRAGGRQDLRLQSSVSAKLDRLGYMGFAPVLSLDYSETNSNVSLYDSRSFGVGLTIKSLF